MPDDLPRAPGVYRFEAVGGTTLYVGKSVDLRRRVRGWFYGGGPDDPRLAEMVALARAVRIEPTGSDLEARLVEAEWILAARPRYNRALKNRGRGWYLEIDPGEPFPRLRVVGAPRRAGARYFGPWRGRATPERIARLVERVFRLRSCPGAIRPDPAGSPCLAHGLDLCSAPCVREIGLDGYRASVERAAAALADPGRARETRRRLVAERDHAAALLAFERAARLQRRIGWLDELDALRLDLEGRWLEGSWLIVLPHAAEGRVVVTALVRGRVRPRRSAAWGSGAWRRTLEDACYAARVAALRAEPVRAPADLVASGIVTRWLVDGAPGGLPVDLDRYDDREAVALVEAWWRAGGASPGSASR